MTRPKSLLLTVIALAGAALLLAWSQDWFLVRLAGAEHPVGGDVAAGAVAAALYITRWLTNRVLQDPSPPLIAGPRDRMCV